MADLILNKLDTDAPFKLQFTPRDDKGNPTGKPPVGGVSMSSSDPSIATVAPFDATTALYTLTGKIGTATLTMNDSAASASAHLTVASGAETGATLEEIP